MIKDYFQLAYQSARKRQLRSWLTMIGIFIGIAAVVALISLSQGLKAAISEQFVKLGSDKLIIQAAGSSFGPPGTAVTVPLTTKDKEVAEKTKGVDKVVARLLRIVKLELNKEVKYSYILSLPGDAESWQLAVEVQEYQIETGKLLPRDAKHQVMVGHDFAQDFFDRPLEVRDKIKIQDVSFEIVGILKKSGNPQKDETLVIAETDLRELLNIKEDYDLIAVKVQPGTSLASVSESLQKELRQSRNVEAGKEDFSVQTPENILATLNTIMLIVQGVLVGIAAISLLVGGVGIMNTMYTAVVERTKEIGIMKAVGAKNSEIVLIFLIESGMLGLVGGLIGVALGFAISKTVEIVTFQIYESYLIQAQFSFLLLFGALFFAFIVGAFSGLFPARQAALLKPVEALRK